MTREEEIIEAGIEYTMQNSPRCIGGDNFYEQTRELNRNKSFEAGAKWADANPKSTWISVKDDLPCNHEELLENLRDTKMVEVVFQDKCSGKRRVEVRCMTNIKIDYNSSNEWVWKAYWDEDIIYWRPIPEPPKE